MLRLTILSLVVAPLAMLVPGAARAEPPFTATLVSAYSITVDREHALALAKTFAQSAGELDSSCSAATELNTALSRVRIQATTPARILTAVRYFLKYGHVLFGVDSTCQAARKLSGFALGLNALAKQLFPSCVPPGSLLFRCGFSRSLSFHLHRDFRTFAPDVCYWTFTDLGLARLYGGNTLRYRPVHKHCR